jgi:hexulose-6-phosphate isomerase
MRTSLHNAKLWGADSVLLVPAVVNAQTSYRDAWTRSAWFDVGNVMFYGYPQDWIRTLGKSIVDVHLKDFKRKEDGYAWVNLGDGEVDWPAVREAFTEIGYSGSAVVELHGGDEAYLRDVSRRVDRLLLGRS